MSSSSDDYIFLYHGTARSDEFVFPKYKSHPTYSWWSPFSWFSDSREAAERYARLDKMNGNHGDTRVLCYYIHKNDIDRLCKVNNLVKYAEDIFGHDNYIINNGGKHSLVYRVNPRDPKNHRPRNHFKYFLEKDYTGFIEKGGIFDSTDYVFLEDFPRDMGAHNHLQYMETIYL
jgi:hypothetical protein